MCDFWLSTFVMLVCPQWQKREREPERNTAKEEKYEENISENYQTKIIFNMLMESDRRRKTHKSHW